MFSSFPICVPLQILQVTAIDLDTGNNARLTYHIVGGDQQRKQQQPKQQQQQSYNTTTRFIDVDTAELFGIYPNSGWLYLRGTIDREARDRYNISVMASDNGTPSLSATTHIIINVMDANDNDPIFSRDSYEFSVEENLRRGYVIGIVSATDADIDENAAIRYSLIPSNTSFHVNPVTGNVHYLHFIIIIILHNM